MNDITTAFHEYFEIIIADTPALLKKVFNLRYRILCVDNKYPDIDASSYPDELESDEYDSSSLHLLLRHKPSNTFVGTTRLILSNPLDINQKFPVELHTQFYPAYTNMNVQRRSAVEISRFVILRNFFRRKDDFHFVVGKISKHSDESGRRRFPHPMLGLAIGIIQICAKYDIYHLFSAMDPALNRLFGFYGMQFEPIGPLVNYHGQRRPYYVCLIDVLERMYTNYRDIWELVTDNGRVWPANLEDFKSICRCRQGVPYTDTSIVTC
ncbi:PEP-CTERM/exosortase system-associated acyltransferase [Nitrosomonas sp. Nm132]|jgi:N-acyl amino acid synthase of PEP-CTERM/exosortase system|uniref:PEP-CTERM/exosortase system-associated acyltransferase n=1 Tax=Nitrosomonas sp. Nm132 TaxID=1881053 RepID=UPI00088D1722|nr:PEP-CTERM/exosortase system-associated acyltransferase [Nitrosomonas sp. Nm132]SDH66985.1 N-acyl amino acid synthase, PEP-CTERM/exosortase system-associated [Nitrosomonas sp. Nm132]